MDNGSSTANEPVSSSLALPFRTSLLAILIIFSVILRSRLNHGKARKPKQSRTRALQGFTTNDGITFCRDIVSASKSGLEVPSSRSSDGIILNACPDIVILCTWMDAVPRHILKYTDEYAAMFPSTSQFIVTSSFLDLTVRSHRSQRRRYASGVEILQKTLNKSPNAKVLLHIFCDGGANTVCHLANELRARFDLQFPAARIVLDSSPGLGNYQTSLQGITSSIPSGILIRSVMLPIVHIYLATVWTLRILFDIENTAERRRRELMDGRFFPAQAPRLYLYSKSDKIVPFDGVERHIEDSRLLGLNVESLRFDDSPHVGHIQKHGCEYWESVRMLWRGPTVSD